jgi:hypothetical protein
MRRGRIARRWRRRASVPVGRVVGDAARVGRRGAAAFFADGRDGRFAVGVGRFAVGAGRFAVGAGRFAVGRGGFVVDRPDEAWPC